MSTELPMAVNKMELLDVGKVLLMFHSANLAQVAIEEQNVDSIVFLLQARQVIPFDYALRLKPLPYSPRLHEDVYNLIQTGYLAKTSPIYITAKGSEWVTNLLQRHEYTGDLLRPIVDQLKDLAGGGRDLLFRAVYSEISR